MLAVDWGDGKVPVHISGKPETETLRRIPISDWVMSVMSAMKKCIRTVFAVLRKAFESYKAVRSESKVKLAAGLPEYKNYDNFIRDNADWIENYALFMAVKEHFNGVVWSEWDDDIRFRTEEGLKKYRSLLADDIDFWIFVQYEFDKQWQKLKNYVNSIGVEIIGDIPIYMGYDSADVWAKSQYFQLNEDRLCEKVAGVPPDAFSDLGQKWESALRLGYAGKR